MKTKSSATFDTPENPSPGGTGKAGGPGPKPNYWWALFSMKCPRCRRGRMFTNGNAYKKLRLSHITNMPAHCEVCKLKFEREPGFWYGTGYVSYALAVAVSGATFVAWIVLIGMGLDDNRWLWWLCSNALLLLVLQPWLMRLSRVVYLYFFVKYKQPPLSPPEVGVDGED